MRKNELVDAASCAEVGVAAVATSTTLHHATHHFQHEHFHHQPRQHFGANADDLSGAHRSGGGGDATTGILTYANAARGVLVEVI